MGLTVGIRSCSVRNDGGSSCWWQGILHPSPSSTPQGWEIWYFPAISSHERYVLDGATKADQIFLPVLENASKAQQLRVTLSVFERSKFFFNLPVFIIESIEAVGTPHFYIAISSLSAPTYRVVTKWLYVIIRKVNTCWKTVQGNCCRLGMPKIPCHSKPPNTNSGMSYTRFGIWWRNRWGSCEKCWSLSCKILTGV